MTPLKTLDQWESSKVALTSFWRDEQKNIGFRNETAFHCDYNAAAQTQPMFLIE
jgi:hypothetical protein